MLEEIKSQLKGASSAREYFDALATRIDFESMYLLEYADILNTGGKKNSYGIHIFVCLTQII